MKVRVAVVSARAIGPNRVHTQTLNKRAQVPALAKDHAVMDYVLQVLDCFPAAHSNITQPCVPPFGSAHKA
eukprot:3500668-Amphidinium_carterae.1